MNRERSKGQWQEATGRIQEPWGQNDDESSRHAGRREPASGRVHERRSSRDGAERRNALRREEAREQRLESGSAFKH